MSNKYEEELIELKGNIHEAYQDNDLDIYLKIYYLLHSSVTSTYLSIDYMIYVLDSESYEYQIDKVLELLQ